MARILMIGRDRFRAFHTDQEYDKTHVYSDVLDEGEEIYIYIYIVCVCVCVCVCVYVYIYTVACESLGTPCRICENVNNFNKIREIIQNACYFLFSTVLSKTFYIKYVYI